MVHDETHLDSLNTEGEQPVTVEHTREPQLQAPGESNTPDLLSETDTKSATAYRQGALLLKPEMRVRSRYSPVERPKVSGTVDSLAIASPILDDRLLAEMVRREVKEQLRGGLGRDIVQDVFTEMLRTITKKS